MHPVLSTEARTALTLRLLGGLTTDEIARAFLAAEPTIAQRIVRAKRTLADAAVPFEVPRGSDRTARVSSVLEVIYLVFPTKATRRPRATTGCARNSARTRCASAASSPSSCRREPEVHGLVALMEIQASRARARTAPDGSPILLLDQDRSRWDRLLIVAASQHSNARSGSARQQGPYALQAAIAACHAPRDERRRDRLAAHHRALFRARAARTFASRRAQSRGRRSRWRLEPAAGLALVDTLRDVRVLENYHLLPSVRGDLLSRLERYDDAREEFERAAAMDAQRARACAVAGARGRLRVEIGRIGWALAHHSDFRHLGECVSFRHSTKFPSRTKARSRHSGEGLSIVIAAKASLFVIPAKAGIHFPLLPSFPRKRESICLCATPWPSVRPCWPSPALPGGRVTFFACTKKVTAESIQKCVVDLVRQVISPHCAQEHLGWAVIGQGGPRSRIELTGDGIERALAMHRQIRPLGRYWRNSPFVFSQIPRCQGLLGSAK